MLTNGKGADVIMTLLVESYLTSACDVSTKGRILVVGCRWRDSKSTKQPYFTKKLPRMAYSWGVFC